MHIEEYYIMYHGTCSFRKGLWNSLHTCTCNDCFDEKLNEQKKIKPYVLIKLFQKDKF